jgi:hypothetical protein
VDRLIPERVACASPTARLRSKLALRATTRGARPPCDDPAPGSVRLTAQPLASVRSTTPAPLPIAGARCRRATAHLWAVPPRRGVVDRVRRWRTTSDALCRAPKLHRSRRPGFVRSTEDRSPASSSKGASCVDPERLPSTGCSRGSAFAEPVLVGARHRCLGFAAEGPGFRRAFTAPMLSPGAARPDVGSGGSSPLVATGRTPPVDFCNLLRSATATAGSSEPRAPRPWSPTSEAVFRTAPLRGRNGLRVAVCVLRQGQPRFHGPGASIVAIRR